MVVQGTVGQLADYLVDGYWRWAGQIPHHFTSPTIGVDLSALTAADQALARSALSLWAEVADLHFVFGGSGPSIVYSAPTSGALAGVAATGDAYDDVSGSVSLAQVNIGAAYTATERAEAFIHETGHALGLGHLGPYDSKFAESIYSNDTVQWSVMSYGRQNALGNKATSMAVDSPAMADIAAIQSIYGANISVRGESTVYGFHSNAGATYDFAVYTRPNFTIYDTDGAHDMLDASGFNQGATISLEPGTWSSVGGFKGNIGIYVTSLIEDATGGGGSDSMTGNAGANLLDGGNGNDMLHGGDGADTLRGGAGADMLDGGTGADRLEGGAGNDTYLVDPLDTIVEAAGGGTDSVFAGFSYHLGDALEKLALTGAAPIDGFGNGLANTLTGNDADNRLDGGAGKDILVGKAGADSFMFDVLTTSAQRDTIADFVSGSDRIELSSKAFSALAVYGLGTLDTGELCVGPRATAVDQHLIYNDASGLLCYDPDGSGRAALVQIVQLTGHPALVAADIVIA